MSEEIKKNEQPQVEEQPKEQEAQKPAPITLSMISKGTLELACRSAREAQMFPYCITILPS